MEKQNRLAPLSIGVIVVLVILVVLGIVWYSKMHSQNGQNKDTLHSGYGSHAPMHGWRLQHYEDVPYNGMDYMGCPGAASQMPGIAGDAKTEADALAAMNGGENFTGSGPHNWPRKGTADYSPGTFPHRSYSGHRGLWYTPMRPKSRMTPGPQFEWDQPGSYAAAASSASYPYYAYSGYHGGIYPTQQELDDSYHW